MLEVFADSDRTGRMRAVWRVMAGLAALAGLVVLGTALVEVVAGAGGCDAVPVVAMDSAFWIRRVVVPIAAGTAVSLAAVPVTEYVRARRSPPVFAAAAAGVTTASAVCWFAGNLLSEIVSRLAGQLLYGFDTGTFAQYFDAFRSSDTVVSLVPAIVFGAAVLVVRVWAGLRGGSGSRPWIVPAVTFVLAATLITASAALAYPPAQAVGSC